MKTNSTMAGYTKRDASELRAEEYVWVFGVSRSKETRSNQSM
jgi:hypothetical protein